MNRAGQKDPEVIRCASPSSHRSRVRCGASVLFPCFGNESVDINLSSSRLPPRENSSLPTLSALERSVRLNKMLLHQSRVPQVVVSKVAATLGNFVMSRFSTETRRRFAQHQEFYP